MIDQKDLQERLARLAQQRSRTEAQLNQVLGAEQICRQMLGDLMREEDAGGTSSHNVPEAIQDRMTSLPNGQCG